MPKSKFLRLALVLVGTSALCACGGGSSADPVPVVSTSDPDPAPTAETITVTGFVTDMPIVNATVVITVNGQQFTAPNPTGADGSFSVDIESTDPEALVLCEAFDPTGPVRFSALLDNFAGLQGDAGDDGVAEEVNITNVTTAQFLLAQEAAVDGSIDDIEELQAVAAQIDPLELLELSAAIKVVVDAVAGVTLPDDFDNVQELAQAIVDGVTTFLEDIETVNPGILQATVNEVVSDGFATMEFSAERIPGVYVDADAEDLVVMFADGTGYSAETVTFQTNFGTLEEEQLIEPITWSVSSTGQLQIVFTDSQDVDTVTLLNDAGGVLTVVSDELAGDTGEEDTSTFTVVRFGFDADGFNAASVAGSYRATDADDDEATEFAVFLTDGSGYDIDVATGEIDDVFTWEVNAAGELLITDDGMPDSDQPLVSDERQIVRLLEGSTADTPIFLAMELELDGDRVTSIEAFPVAYTSEIFTTPQPDMANTMLLEGKSYAFFDGDERGIVTFGENGVFAEIIQDFDDQDGPDWDERDGEWFVDANGMIFLTFVADNGEADNDQATVVSGLGADLMTVVVEDDGVEDEFVLTRVVPFTATEVSGTWQFNVSGPTSEDIAVFNADGSGSYSENGVVNETFEWSVTTDGLLIVALDDGTQQPFTETYYKLADSTPEQFHVVAVFRLGGVLENDAIDPGGAPQVVVEYSLSRLSDGT